MQHLLATMTSVHYSGLRGLCGYLVSGSHLDGSADTEAPAGDVETRHLGTVTCSGFGLLAAPAAPAAPAVLAQAEHVSDLLICSDFKLLLQFSTPSSTYGVFFERDDFASSDALKLQLPVVDSCLDTTLVGTFGTFEVKCII